MHQEKAQVPYQRASVNPRVHEHDETSGTEARAQQGSLEVCVNQDASARGLKPTQTIQGIGLAQPASSEDAQPNTAQSFQINLKIAGEE